MPLRKKRVFQLTLLFVLIGLGYGYLGNWISVETVKRIIVSFSDEISQYPVMTGILLLGIHALGMLLSLPVKALFSLVAGALLGVVCGAIVTMTGVLTGSSALFFGIRYFRRPSSSFSLSEKWRSILIHVERFPIRTIAGLRLLLTIPYGPITILAALSPMRYRDFLLGSLFGDIPVVLLYVSAGMHFMEISRTTEAVPRGTIALFCLAGTVLLVSVWGSNVSLFRRGNSE